jgi:hypothetical protein
VNCVAVSVLATLPGGFNPKGPLLREVVNSNLAEGFFVCAASTTVGIQPFSLKYFEDIIGDFDAAAEWTRHCEEAQSALQTRRGRPQGTPGLGSPANTGSLRPTRPGMNPPVRSGSRGDGGYRPGDGVGLGVASPSGNAARFLTPVQAFGMQDPQPEHDDAATLTMDGMMQQCDVAISQVMLERVFLGRPRPLMSGMQGRLCFEDFVWFVAMQSDRMAFSSIDYWVRCLDLDDDGCVSPRWLERSFGM